MVRLLGNGRYGARFPRYRKIEPGEIEPGASAYAILVDGLAGLVEGAGNLHPREVSREAGAPDDRGDAARGQVERADRRARHAGRNLFGWIVLGWRLIEAGALDVLVDHPLRFRRGFVSEAYVFADTVAEG